MRPKVLTALTALLVIGALIGILGPTPAAEAQQPSAAVISAVTGQVRVMARGETTFRPAQLGMRLLEGTDVVAGGGSSAELRLPDNSTVMVSENTRFVVTKLDFDPQNRMRASFFHLAAGKLRGIVTKAATALVAARQSNFAITTPTAVAAVRGTTVYASFDPVTNQTTFLVTDGIAIIRDAATGQTVTLTAGQVTTMAPGRPPTPPAPVSAAQQQQMTSNASPSSPGVQTVLNAPTVVVIPGDVAIVTVNQAIAAAPPATGGGPGQISQPPIMTVVPQSPMTSPTVEVSK